jgi:hypothetical protein
MPPRVSKAVSKAAVRSLAGRAERNMGVRDGRAITV